MEKAQLFSRKSWPDVIQHEKANFLGPFLLNQFRPFGGERREVFFNGVVRFFEHGPFDTVAPTSLQPFRNPQGDQDDAGQDDDEWIAQVFLPHGSAGFTASSRCRLSYPRRGRLIELLGTLSSTDHGGGQRRAVKRERYSPTILDGSDDVANQWPHKQKI